MRLYIAGPMSGYADLNWPAFFEAEKRLYASGYDVINPARNGFEGIDRETNLAGYQEAVRVGLQQVLSCDGVALLPNWHQSQGTGAERRTALAAGIPCRPIQEWLNDARAEDDRTLKFVGDDRWAPTRGYEGDAGLDLRVAQSVHIHVGGFFDVPCGISVQLPRGTWGLITGRSSTIRKKGLLVVNGVIDNGYRGPLFAAVQNVNEKPVTIEAGERIAQLLLFPLIAPRTPIKQVSQLDEAERGARAFGSTGI